MNRYFIVDNQGKEFTIDADRVVYRAREEVTAVLVGEKPASCERIGDEVVVAWFEGRVTVVKLNAPKDELLVRLDEKDREIAKLKRQIEDAKMMVEETKRFRFRRLKRDIKNLFAGGCIAVSNYGSGYSLMMFNPDRWKW